MAATPDCCWTYVKNWEDHLITNLTSTQPVKREQKKYMPEWCLRGDCPVRGSYVYTSMDDKNKRGFSPYNVFDAPKEVGYDPKTSYQTYGMYATSGAGRTSGVSTPKQRNLAFAPVFALQ